MSFIKNQRTIAKETSCVGIGLHTGVESRITFKPAPEDFGIRFKRMDVEGCPEIKADIDHVVDISRGCLLYTSPSPRDKRQSRMPSSA